MQLNKYYYSSNFVCEPTVRFGVKTQKNIYVLISVKCLIIGFILCRINNNNINKEDDNDVEDKNNYNDKNNLLRLMFFKQQTTGLSTYLWENEGTLSEDIFASFSGTELGVISVTFRQVAVSASSTANNSHQYETLGSLYRSFLLNCMWRPCTASVANMSESCEFYLLELHVVVASKP